MLFYPSQYEGEEQSPHVIYTGATPRQQALPAVDFLREQRCRRFALIGSDGVYSRTTNAILRNYLRSRGIADEAMLEVYARPGECAWRETVERIARFGGSSGAIISTINGDANVHFLREYARQNLSPQLLPVMTLSLGEAELPSLAGVPMAGHLASWSYLGAIAHPRNNVFVHQWRAFIGDAQALPNDPMEATLLGFRMWVAAVERAGTIEAKAVRAALAGMTCDAPSGVTVRLDPQTQHLHKPAVIGRFTEAGTIVPVWQSAGLVPPEP